ncbi:hypothetical protein BCV72DRAFT_202891, partial [Rhizopus microsporus var. microsporus]
PTLKQLQTELSAIKAEIARLQQQNASLCERLTLVCPVTVLETDFLSKEITRYPFFSEYYY